MVILDSLCKAGLTSRLKAAKIIEIDIDAKPNTLYSRLAILCKAGLVSKGLSEGHAHTYYITTEGVEFLAEDIKEEEETEANEQLNE